MKGDPEASIDRWRGPRRVILLSTTALIAVIAAIIALGGLGLGGALEIDPRRPYDYRLAERGGAVVEVAVERAGLIWPALPVDADTLFLELDARGARGQPWLEVDAGETSFRQYFEPRARGLRYLNLSPLAGAVAAGTQVRFSGHRLRWQSGVARLVAFANPETASARVLVLAPHPDDAEIAAFGLYSQSDADVVTVTAGDAGGWNYRELFPEPETHYRIKGEIRTWDSVTVPFLGGVAPGRARNLGYSDATLKKLWDKRPATVPPPLAKIDSADHFRRLNVPTAGLDRPAAGFDTPMEPSWPSLVDDLALEIARVQPRVIVAPHPFLDAHRDHQYTTIALVEALERVGCAGCELYLYTNHPVEEETFPFGERDGVVALPPWYGTELEAERILSLSLSPQRQRLKLLALEAMHDLRDFDLAGPPGLGSLASDLLIELGRRIRGPGPSYSYFRRAGRPNEVFFVISVEQAIGMRRRFLDRAPGSSR